MYVTRRRNVYNCISLEEKCILLEEVLYITGRRNVYDQNKVFILLEEGVYSTGKTTVYYWKKEVCFKITYSTIEPRSFNFSFN